MPWLRRGRRGSVHQMRLDQIDAQKSTVVIHAMRKGPADSGLEYMGAELYPVFLSAAASRQFLAIMGSNSRREPFEADLRSRAHDGRGNVTVATRLTLEWFRDAVLAAREEAADHAMQEMFGHVIWQTAGWRAAGADHVEVCLWFSLSSVS